MTRSLEANVVIIAPRDECSALPARLPAPNYGYLLNYCGDRRPGSIHELQYFVIKRVRLRHANKAPSIASVANGAKGWDFGCAG